MLWPLKLYLLLEILQLAVNIVLSEKADFHSDQVLDVITFGSCNRHDEPQPFWDSILNQTPDLWIWLGDAIYADSRIMPFLWIPSTLETMKEKFDLQKQNPGYKGLIESNTPIIGIWDDHDYGNNDGGKNFKYRLQAQDLFLDFLDEPVNSIRRRREGVYASYTYGVGKRKVKIILLDVRSHYVSDYRSCDILGDDQWKWLERQLDDNTTALTLIGTGLQVLSDIPFIEKWMRCSSSLDRLVWLTQKYPRVVFLSGDVHFSEVNCLNATSTGYPLYEVTSSGMTHSCSASLLPSGVCHWTLKNVVASKYRISKVVTNKNYGVIKINWNAEPVRVTIEIIGSEGMTSTVTLGLGDLSVRSKPASCPVSIEQPNWYWKRVFWSGVIIILLAVVAVVLRLMIAVLRWISMVLLKDLDTKIKHRLKKIRDQLPNVRISSRNKTNKGYKIE